VVAPWIQEITIQVLGAPLLAVFFARGLINGCGVVFELARNSKGEWKERILHDFSNDPGIFPYAVPLLDQAGNLYGPTAGDNVKS
jgi:hypothetical protein